MRAPRASFRASRPARPSGTRASTTLDASTSAWAGPAREAPWKYRAYSTLAQDDPCRATCFWTTTRARARGHGELGHEPGVLRVAPRHARAPALRSVLHVVLRRCGTILRLPPQHIQRHTPASHRDLHGLGHRDRCLAQNLRNWRSLTATHSRPLAYSNPIATIFGRWTPWRLSSRTRGLDRGVLKKPRALRYAVHRGFREHLRVLIPQAIVNHHWMRSRTHRSSRSARLSLTHSSLSR